MGLDSNLSFNPPESESQNNENKVDYDAYSDGNNYLSYDDSNDNGGINFPNYEDTNYQNQIDGANAYPNYGENGNFQNGSQFSSEYDYENMETYGMQDNELTEEEKERNK